MRLEDNGMPAGQLKQTVQHLRRLMGGDARLLSDRQLLGHYAASKEDAAFAVLVERHAPMVLGVCRRVLSHNQDAEDACQAAFLVLARKAGAIRKRDSLRCWLHGVAYRVASNLRKQRLRRPADPLAEAAIPPDDISWREVQRILDEELLRLPEQFRLPLILCYLEGKTRDEAAEELGWTASTFRGRLVRGRERLRKRLESKGVGLTAGLLAALLSQAGEAHAVPCSLIESLVQSTGAGATSAAVRSLAEGATPTMFAHSMKMSVAVLVSVGLFGGGIALLHEGAPAITMPTAAAHEADKERAPEKESAPKKDAAAKPLGDKELQATASKVRDAAIEWLKKNQRADGTWEGTSLAFAWKGGSTALAVMALVESGVKANDPALTKALKYLRELKSEQTYVVALQTIALSRVNEKKDAAILSRNVEWLEAAALMGPNAKDIRGWSYGKMNAMQSDYSNTQYALFALYEAGRAGVKPKNKKFWEGVRAMYLGTQRVDGGWGYRPDAGATTFSMTCAGLCGLYLADDDMGNESAESRKAKKLGFVWLARSYQPSGGTSAFYNLHVLARLGKLSGDNKIGDHDWYAEGVEWLLKHQDTDGSISSKNSIDNIKVISTAFAILFLNSAGEKKASKNDTQPEKHLAANADCIFIAKASGVPDDPQPGFETVSFEVSRTLKGKHVENLTISMPQAGDTLSLGDSKEWIVFLRTQNEGERWPLTFPFDRKGWFIRADADAIKRVEAAIPMPKEWGKELGGLQLGIRLRQETVRANEEVPVEVFIKNVSDNDITVMDLRYNIYDYWPHSRFEVTGPDGKKWLLEKPVTKISEDDIPMLRTLKPGQHLLTTMRLNYWPARQPQPTAPEPVANLFTTSGEYVIVCRYDNTQVKGPPVPLVSNSVKLVVTKD